MWRGALLKLTIVGIALHNDLPVLADAVVPRGPLWWWGCGWQEVAAVAGIMKEPQIEPLEAKSGGGGQRQTGDRRCQVLPGKKSQQCQGWFYTSFSEPIQSTLFEH